MRLDDLGEGQVNQFAMAKAIASAHERLTQKVRLEADIARLVRLRASMMTPSSRYAGRSAMPNATSRYRPGGSAESATTSSGWCRL